MTENKSLYLNGRFITYKLTWKKIKKINLKVSDEGSIQVSAPLFINIKYIEKFLYLNSDFIEKGLLKKKESNIFNLSKGVISILGIEYNVIKQLASKNSLKIVDNNVCINYKDLNLVNNIIKKHLKKIAMQHFEERLNHLSKMMNLNYNSFSVRWMKTKWGHCDKLKNILLNYKLICYRDEVIDYVIVHELAHTIHMNHGVSFWNLVGKYCPEWKKHEKELKK